MREPPPLFVAVPVGAVAGAAIGVIGASFYLTWVLGLSLDAFDMLLILRLGAIERSVYAEEMRRAYLGIGILTLAGAALVAAGFWQRRLTTYGDAHWQSRQELKANGMIGEPGAGFVCAKLGPPMGGAPYIVARDRPHVMMIAPTRAGKGVGFVIPNLLSFEGSVVALDVKGELFKATARWRAREKRRVHRFAPFDWESPGARYNPLARVAELETPEQRYTAVEKLSNLFLDRDNRQNDTFSEAGKSIFIAACLLALQRGTPTLGAVREIVLEGHDKKRQYRRYSAEAAGKGDDTARLLWMEAASTSDKLLTSNIQALMTGGFRAWNNPAVRRATSASDFDFATFRARPQSLYLCVAEDDIEALSPLLRMMFGELIATLRHHEPGADEPHAVMVMMDEFQQMGAMPYLERAIHTLASYGGRVAIIAQSLASLDRIYGAEGREGFEAGSALKLYIQPRDQRTVAEVSRAVGSCTREAVTRSYGAWRGFGGMHGQSVREEERPLLSETAARTLDPDDVIVLAAPLMPIRARRIKHYEDPTFAKMMRDQETMPWPEASKAAAPAAAPVGNAQEPVAEAKPTEPVAAAGTTHEGFPEPKGGSSRSPATHEGLHGDRPTIQRMTDTLPRDAIVPQAIIAHIQSLEKSIAALNATLRGAVERLPAKSDAKEAPALTEEPGPAGMPADADIPPKLSRLRRVAVPSGRHARSSSAEGSDEPPAQGRRQVKPSPPPSPGPHRTT